MENQNWITETVRALEKSISSSNRLERDDEDTIKKLFKVLLVKPVLCDDDALLGVEVLVRAICNPNITPETAILAGGCVSIFSSCRDVAPSLAAAQLQELTQTEYGEPEMDFMYRIALLKGILISGMKNLLVCDVSWSALEYEGLPPSGPFIVTLYPYIRQLTLKNNKTRMHAFQLLHSWLQAINVCYKAAPHKMPAMANVHREILRLTWSLLIGNCETPFPGGAQTLRSCLSISLTRVPDYHQALLDSIVQVSWRQKSKYVILATLLPHVGVTKVLERFPNLSEGLFISLSCSHLAAPGGDIYKQIVNSISADLWKEVFSDSFFKAVWSKESMVSHYAMIYWIPCVVATYESLIPWALDKVWKSDNPTGFAIICHLAKKNGFVIRDSYLAKLHLCLLHMDNRVRMEAFSTVCTSRKKRELAPVEDLHLILDFLSLNMNIDDSFFRGSIIKQIKDFVSGVCSGCYASLRCDRDESMLPYLRFVEDLYNMAIFCLHPRSNYQRKITALMLLEVVLYQFYVPVTNDSSIRNHKTPQESAKNVKVSEAAHQRGLWRFDECVDPLLICAFDEYDDIREKASSMILSHFRRDFSSILEILWKRFEEVVGSPRFQDAEVSGVLTSMMVTMLIKEPVELPGIRSPQHLYNHLLKGAKHDLEVLRADVCLVATASPLHPTLTALRHCISVRLPSEPNDLLTFIEVVVDFILGILKGNKDVSGSIPSFEEMGKVLSDLCEDDDVVLSGNFKILVSCIDLILRECCAIGSCLVSPSIMDTSSLSRILDLIVKVLSTCRHVGVTEDVSESLQRTATALFKGGFEKLVEKVLDQVLLNVQTSEGVSVTRRGAGIPRLLRELLLGEVHPQRPLLMRTLNTLVSIAQKPLPPSYPEQQDLPQVQVLHALQALVKEARISLYLTPRVPELCMLCLEGLKSPLWSVRNGSLQLYGACVSRMVGQKGNPRNQQQLLSIWEFFLRFPGHLEELATYMEVELEREKDCSRRLLERHDSVIPVLNLLAFVLEDNYDASFFEKNLKADCEAIQSRLKLCLRQLLKSPVQAARQLSAFVLSNLISSRKKRNEIDWCCEMLHQQMEWNCFHGVAVYLSILLKDECVQYPKEYLANIRDQITDIATQDIPASVKAILIDSLIYTRSSSSVTNKFSFLQSMTSVEVDSCPQSYVGKVGICNSSWNPASEVGTCVFTRKLLGLHLKTLPKDECIRFVCTILRHPDPTPDQVDVVLSYLISHLRSFTLSSGSCLDLQSALITYIRKERHFDGLLQSLTLFRKLHSLRPSYVDSQASTLVKNLSGITASLPNSEVCAAVMTALACLADAQLKNRTSDGDALLELCELIHRNARPQCNENSRLASAHCLNIVGANIINSGRVEAESDTIQKCQFMVMRTLMILLWDGDIKVRNKVVRCVSNMMSRPTDKEQSRSCYKQFRSHIPQLVDRLDVIDFKISPGLALQVLFQLAVTIISTIPLRNYLWNDLCEERHNEGVEQEDFNCYLELRSMEMLGKDVLSKILEEKDRHEDWVENQRAKQLQQRKQVFSEEMDVRNLSLLQELDRLCVRCELLGLEEPSRASHSRFFLKYSAFKK